MISKESDIRPIGYGAMIVEGFVSTTALVAACALAPGDYFAINTPQDPNKPAQVAAYQAMKTDALVNHGLDLEPVHLADMEARTQEKLVGRTGGAVTLAVGMAEVFSKLPGMKTLTSYW